MAKFERQVLPVTELRLDLENPRLPQTAETQLEAIRVNGERQGTKLEVLCADILERGGLNPLEQPCVLKDTSGYVVLEGNRRVLALKILHEPALLKHMPTLDAPTQKHVRAMSAKFSNNPIDVIECVIAPSREAANPWIELRHSGQLGGAGLVKWNAQEKQRWEARQTGKKRPELEILDFVTPYLPEDEQEKVGSLAISTLGRLLSDPDFRTAMGLKRDESGLSSIVPPKVLAHGLARVVNDMLGDDFSVKRVYYKEDRRQYLKDVGDDLPDRSKMCDAWRLSDAPPPEPEASPKARRPRRRPVKRRIRLIPKDCILYISKPRVDGLYRELLNLDLEEFPNVAWVNIRVFLELSVNCYIRAHKNSLPSVVPDDASLSHKLQVTAAHMQDCGKMTKDDLKPIKKVAEKGKHYMYASIPSLNDAAHDEDAVPRIEEMVRSWDEIQPFMEAIWPLSTK